MAEWRREKVVGVAAEAIAEKVFDLSECDEKAV